MIDFVGNGCRRKEIFARHSEVALRIRRRHAPLISKREANFFPRKIMHLGGNPRVHRCRCVPARECNPERVALANSFVRLLKNESSSVGDEIFGTNHLMFSFHTKARSIYRLTLISLATPSPSSFSSKMAGLGFSIARLKSPSPQFHPIRKGRGGITQGRNSASIRRRNVTARAFADNADDNLRRARISRRVRSALRSDD